MKPVLVLLHIFYTEQIPYFIDKLKNIVGTDWDLVVTGNIPESDRRQILSFKKDSVFLPVENRGYDIWPFIAAVKSVDLSKYSFVIKLHTKNTDTNSTMRMNGRKFTGSQWRDTMVDALLGSGEAFLKVRKAFESDSTGLVFAMSVCILSRQSRITDSVLLKDELARLGIVPSDLNYCGGTIFAVRAEALQFLKSGAIGPDIFPPSGESHSDCTITHSYERILCIGVTSQGYRIHLIPQHAFQKFSFKAKRCLQPVLEWIFSIDHKNGGGKYLTIFGVTLPLSS